MSFLDATGLGTFWSKLKNYFVPKTNFEAPVTGLTDILTPVNLMPNSDFSRSGGITYPIEIASMGSSFTTFADYWQIQCFSGSCSNVSLTVEKNIGSRYNLLSIQGTAATVTTGSDGIKYIVLRIRNTNVNYYRNSALWYTDTFKLEKVGSQSYTLSGSSAHSGSEGGAIRTNGLNVINIFRTSGTNTLPYFTISLTNINVGDTFQIRVYDCATYLGGYKNPPIMPSLDNMPGNQFMLRDYSNFKGSDPIFGGALTVNKRYRLFKISPNNDITTSSFTLIKGYNGSSPLMFNISFATSDIVYNSTHHYTAYIKINALSSNNYDVANMVKSAQVTYDADGNMYICITTGATTMNSNNWYITADRVSASGKPSSIFNYISSIAPFTESPSTDTVIVSANTIVGF